MHIWCGIRMVKTFTRAEHWLFRESDGLDAQLGTAMDVLHGGETFFSFLFFIMILSIYRVNKMCNAFSIIVLWNEQLV